MMNAKKYTFIFLFSSIGLAVLLLGFNLIVDPYDVTGTNLLKIKHKLTRDGRMQKINRIKELSKINNLILGSSRSERLNPATVSHHLGGYTYSFGIGGANIVDALGLLLYLESQNKLPKNIVLFLDFAAFSADLPISAGFYKIPEINFLKTHTDRQSDLPKLFSVAAVRASFKTLKFHLRGKIPDAYIDDNGFLTSRKPTPIGEKERIQKVANEYYNFSYQKGKITFSQERFAYLERFAALCKKHGITLHTLLTPIHISLYQPLEDNKQLLAKLTTFKKSLSHITPYCDSMIKSDLIFEDNNFEDAVHYTQKTGDLLLSALLKGTPSDICVKYDLTNSKP